MRGDGPAVYMIIKLSYHQSTLEVHINPQLSQIKQTIKLSTQMIKKWIDTSYLT